MTSDDFHITSDGNVFLRSKKIGNALEVAISILSGYHTSAFVLSPKAGEREGVCEVKKYNHLTHAKNFYETSCNESFTIAESDIFFKYCPYCGRRIEVVK